MKSSRRKARNYDGTQLTTHSISELLSQQLSSLGEQQGLRPDLILATWPEVIGSQLSPMTEAISFNQGVLTVKVKNSTLHSLLGHDKGRILQNLRVRFPKVEFRNIMFRIG